MKTLKPNHIDTGFKTVVDITDDELMATSLFNERIKEYSNEVAKKKDDVLMEFLKAEGFRPKRTVEYVENLLKRLRRKGKTIACESETKTVKKSEYLLSIEYTFRYRIVPYEKTAFEHQPVVEVDEE